MSDIFISYSSEDRKRVQALAHALERKGWSVWWGRRIRTGGAFDEIIQKALGAAKSVVVVWTEFSIKSTWVKNEARKGMKRGVLFPVMMLQEVEIPLEFEHLQAAHLMDWQPEQDHAGFDQFIDDLAHVIGAPAIFAAQSSPARTSPTPEPEIEPQEGEVRAGPGDNNNLSALTVSPGTLSPSFSASRIFYTVNVGGNVTSVTVTPTLQDTNSIMTINGQGTRAGQARSATLALAGSSTEIEIIVTAPNGSCKTYLITVSRAALPRAAEVEPEPERLEPRPSAATAGAVNYSDSSEESFRLRGATEFLRDGQESAQASQDRSSQSTGLGASTQSFPYLPIGLGLLAVIGALAYFLAFPQDPSPVEREEASYQPAVQSQRPTGEVSTSPPAPESIKAPPAATTLEKPTVKREATAGGTEATKPRPIAGPTKTITGKDGAPMVLIPAGSFQMGSTKDEVERAVQTCVKEYEKDQQTCEGWYNSELPRHQVSLDAFYLDKYEVTNRLFNQFVQQTRYRTTAEREDSAWVFVESKGWEEVKGASWQKPEGSASVFQTSREEHPVVAVSWDDAVSFCRWAGKRLPTEAEWEYAARAGTTTRYWWGQGNPGIRRVENIADEAVKNLLKVIMSGYDDGAVRTAPVGSYETNPWGLHDISGNVREWTADWSDANYYTKSSARNPTGPASGEYRVLRGGSWLNVPDYVRSALRDRDSPARRNDRIGFRCAQDIPK